MLELETVTVVVTVRVLPFAPSPVAVMVQAPAGALLGKVTGKLMSPDELAVVESVSMLQTLMLTFAPAANPLPVIVTVPPGATVLEFELSEPTQEVEPGG